ncbi:GspE/PulE family protein [Patescibacteria group bacterium]|nr:GspE/PulE family protein [Patescibacteria group bacterium]MBU1931708.1 GspE/PulE family protein [Patescibacteria group bacterium]
MNQTAQVSQPAVNTQARTDSLLDILLTSKALNQEQHDQLRLELANTSQSVDQLLVKHKFVSPLDLVKAKGIFYQVPFIDILKTGVSPEVLNLVPEQVARHYQVIPFALDKTNKILSVAMANPLDLAAVEFIRKKSGKEINSFISTEADVLQAINERYAQSLSVEVTEALKQTGVAKDKIRVVDSRRIGEVIREAPIAKIVSTVLEFAIKARASDVHIEPLEDKTRVRYRIDGVLHEKLVLPRNVHDAVVSRIKILCDMKIDEKRIPQDGRFAFRTGNEEVDLRVSSLPTVHGEKIVMRLLKKSGQVPTLPELGLRGRALKNLEQAILVPHGIILVTGPTGSGKTTTLYSVLSKINTPRVNIITLEDPVEYQIPGINQVQVNSQAGLTFASGLRSFLRQDPNIILVGEVRDHETAELAIQASLTGHLVFSTLHTNSASGALPRLLDMKAEPFLLASSMTCIVGQRICRRICDFCKQEYQPSSEVAEDLKKNLGKLLEADKKLTLVKGKGCPECNDTGYHGRVGIFEVLPITEKISRLILERSPSSVIEKQAVEEGMILMKQDGYLKALEHLTTMEEVVRVAQT